MTKEQVQLLRDAGISETAIIDRILADTAEAVPPEAPAEPAEPENPVAALPQPDSPSDPLQSVPREDKVLAAIEKLTGAIFAQNARSIGRETDDSNSVEKILDGAFYQPGGV